MDFYTAYKPFRNKVRGFDSSSLVQLAVKKLHEIFLKPIPENRTYMPWFLLFLIKIAFLEGSSRYPVKHPTENDLAVLHNMLNDLSSKSRFLSENSSQGLMKFLRMIAFQQFWIQNEVTHADLGRQIRLFSMLDWKYPLETKFYGHTGISILDFIELCFITWGRFFSENNYYIDENWFSNIRHKYPDDTINNFFKLSSLQAEEAKSFLEKTDKKIKSMEFKFFEQTPLKRYPFLRGENKYFCYTPLLLNEFSKNFIYDFMKEKDSNEFSENFGTVFEKYIELGLDFSKTFYISEKEIKGLFPNRNTVDFIMPEEDSTILMEAKAIEMSPLARVNPSSHVLSNYLKDSIVKAVKQLYVMARALKESSIPKIKNNRKFFGLVVTYKELYLGDGKNAWHEFIEDEIGSFLSEEAIDINILPPENIFFLSIEGFEDLIRVISKYGSSLSEIITDAINNNTKAESKKFVFEQHLSKYDLSGQNLPFIQEPLDMMVNQLMQILRK